MRAINNFDFPNRDEPFINELRGATSVNCSYSDRSHSNRNLGNTLFSHLQPRPKGKAFLVGAGPGDPDLLTVKAIRTLEYADVVLHDALVSAEVLALVSSRARVVNVGKRCGQKCITQEEINGLLVRFASAGEIVVRLKSGDPLIFGRGGEELSALWQAGIDVEVIPGVTASLAAAAKIRVSLTDRRSADQLLFITAHRKHGKQDSDWQKLVNGRTTVVVYMPGEYGGAAKELCSAGLSPSTPCAIVSRVSNADEQWYQTTIGALHHAPSMPSPCVLIVGETVRAAKTEASRWQLFEELSFQQDLGEPAELRTDA